MVSKLSGAYYAMMSVVYISNMNTFKSVYHAHFHSVVKYGIILWDNSSNRGRHLLHKRKYCQNYGCCTTQNFIQKSI
jgi:hypothetical protein